MFFKERRCRIKQKESVLHTRKKRTIGADGALREALLTNAARMSLLLGARAQSLRLHPSLCPPLLLLIERTTAR